MHLKILYAKCHFFSTLPLMWWDQEDPNFHESRYADLRLSYSRRSNSVWLLWIWLFGHRLCRLANHFHEWPSHGRSPSVNLLTVIHSFLVLTWGILRKLLQIFCFFCFRSMAGRWWRHIYIVTYFHIPTARFLIAFKYVACPFRTGA